MDQLECALPLSAENVYVKDFVGNVSTTNLVPGNLELRPRYPVFGGWKYTWWHGYDLPASQSIKQLDNEKYEISISPHFYYLKKAKHGAEKAVWKIILPEGAT